MANETWWQNAVSYRGRTFLVPTRHGSIRTAQNKARDFNRMHGSWVVYRIKVVADPSLPRHPWPRDLPRPTNAYAMGVMHGCAHRDERYAAAGFRRP